MGVIILAVPSGTALLEFIRVSQASEFLAPFSRHGLIARFLVGKGAGSFF